MNDIPLKKVKLILTNDLILALMDIFSLQFSIFIDDVVQRTDVHGRTETQEDVAHHSCYLDGPFY